METMFMMDTRSKINKQVQDVSQIVGFKIIIMDPMKLKKLLILEKKVGLDALDQVEYSNINLY